MDENAAMNEDLKKIMDFVIPNEKIAPKKVEEVAELKIGDIIDPKMDIWLDNRTGKPMLNHTGTLKISQAIGVSWDEPRLDDRPNSNNEKGFYYLVTCRFVDGTSFPATGEANDINTEKNSPSYSFKQNQAIVRGMNKALIRGLGLYGLIWTEDEAEEFKKPAVLKLKEEYEEKLNQLNKKWKERESGLLKLIDGMMKLVALPEDDEKYKKEYIVDVLNEFKDTDYVNELKKSDDKIIGFVANQVLKEFSKKDEKKEMESKETKEDEAKNIEDELKEFEKEIREENNN